MSKQRAIEIGSVAIWAMTGVWIAIVVDSVILSIVIGIAIGSLALLAYKD